MGAKRPGKKQGKGNRGRGRLSMLYAMKALAKKRGNARQYAHFDRRVRAMEALKRRG